MAKEPKRIDITRRPEPPQLGEHLRGSSEPPVIRPEHKHLTIERPLNRASKRNTRGESLLGADSGKKPKRFLDTYRQAHK